MSADHSPSTDAIARRKHKDAHDLALPKIGMMTASTAGQVVAMMGGVFYQVKPVPEPILNAMLFIRLK